MPLTNDGYDPESFESYLQDLIDNFEDELTDAEVNEGSINEALLTSVARTLTENQEQRLDTLYDAAYLATAEGVHLERRADSFGLSRKAAVKATGVVKFSRSSSADQDYLIEKGTVVQTKGDDPIKFETTEKVTLAKGTTSVKANARAVNGGEQGNLGSGRLVVMPSPPAGVESVTNPNPTGDDSYTDTDGEPLIVGKPEESDDQLRERAFELTTIGGAATEGALETVLGDIQRVNSVTIFQNTTNSTDADGLPPTSFEAVVYGGTDKEVAQAIFGTKAVTGETVGGVHGTKTTYTVSSDILDENETIAFSRPTADNLDITIDLVYTDEYGGDEVIKNRVVEYIGGTDTAGERVLGLGVGEDLYVDILEDAIVGSDTGVLGVSDIVIDTDGDGTDDTTTDSNGLTIYDVADSDVALTDATDGSITINSTHV